MDRSVFCPITTNKWFVQRLQEAIDNKFSAPRVRRVMNGGVHAAELAEADNHKSYNRLRFMIQGINRDHLAATRDINLDTFTSFELSNINGNTLNDPDSMKVLIYRALDDQ